MTEREPGDTATEREDQDGWAPADASDESPVRIVEDHDLASGDAARGPQA